MKFQSHVCGNELVTELYQQAGWGRGGLVIFSLGRLHRGGVVIKISNNRHRPGILGGSGGQGPAEMRGAG